MEGKWKEGRRRRTDSDHGTWDWDRDMVVSPPPHHSLPTMPHPLPHPYPPLHTLPPAPPPWSLNKIMIVWFSCRIPFSASGCECRSLRTEPGHWENTLTVRLAVCCWRSDSRSFVSGWRFSLRAWDQIDDVSHGLPFHLGCSNRFCWSGHDCAPWTLIGALCVRLFGVIGLCSLRHHNVFQTWWWMSLFCLRESQSGSLADPKSTLNQRTEW